MDEILEQLHLMSKEDFFCTLMVYACNKVVKVYTYNGFMMYFTDKNTKRKAHSWSGLDFKNFSEAEDKINQSYDEAYISAFLFDGEYYLVEHNEKLDSDDAASIVGIIAGALCKMKEQRPDT